MCIRDRAIAGNAAYHGFFAQGAAAVDLWNRVYSYVAISLNLFFLISLLFLWYMETNITVPLASLSDVTRYYAAVSYTHLDVYKRQLYCAIALVICTILNMSKENEKRMAEAQRRNELRIDSIKLEQMEQQ